MSKHEFEALNAHRYTPVFVLREEQTGQVKYVFPMIDALEWLSNPIKNASHLNG